MATARVEMDEQHIYLKTVYHNAQLARLVLGGKFDKNKAAFKYPRTATAAGKIVEHFGVSDVEYPDEFIELAKKHFVAKKAQKAKSPAVDLPPVPITKYPAWDHQKRAFWFAYSLPAAMLALGMGCGKTKVTVDLIVNRGHRRVLILCPKSVIQTWAEEYPKHAGDDGVQTTIVPLDKGTVKQKTEEAKNAVGERILYIINYESAWREPFATWSKRAGLDLVVCDESHKIKSPGGKASKYCEVLGKIVPYRLCLTGTPMPHSPLDVYAQYRFLDRAIFGTNYTEFKHRYADIHKLSGGGEIVKRYINQDELHRKFYSIAIRFDSDDVLDLPDAIHMHRYCELEPSAMKAYRELENEFYTQVDNGEITAANAVTKLLRLQQLTSGRVPDDDGNLVEVSKAKRQLLEETLEGLEAREPVVVFCRFHQDLDAVKEVAEKQGRRCAELSGRMNQLQEWRRGDYDVIAVQIQSGGAGINLTRAAYVIYYSLGYSLGDYEQSLKRAHRPGQERTVRFYHLLAKGTVDEKVYRALNERKDIVEYVLENRGRQK